ncbi:hypothetical protein A2U01_0073358 [Trifolium medium]|uniref:Uncharacterized protein n=1 Tax=Trifolium medium TaxID=97028 RepID=A0A392SV63_9FABA|nr:hypothetical protein [Trifolium medium]
MVVARCRLARWWRESRQPSPVGTFLPDLSSLPVARVMGRFCKCIESSSSSKVVSLSSPQGLCQNY